MKNKKCCNTPHARGMSQGRAIVQATKQSIEREEKGEKKNTPLFFLRMLLNLGRLREPLPPEKKSDLDKIKTATLVPGEKPKPRIYMAFVGVRARENSEIKMQ